MKKTIREIKKALPNLNSEKTEVLADELDRVLAIKKLFQSEGGQELITLLRNNCSTCLRKLIATSKDKPDLPTLMGIIAGYSANLDLLASLQDIKLEDELREQLDESIKELY